MRAYDVGSLRGIHDHAQLGGRAVVAQCLAHTIVILNLLCDQTVQFGAVVNESSVYVSESYISVRQSLCVAAYQYLQGTGTIGDQIHRFEPVVNLFWSYRFSSKACSMIGGFTGAIPPGLS